MPLAKLMPQQIWRFDTRTRMVWGNSGTLYHQTILKVHQIVHFHPSILFHVSNSGSLQCWSPSQLPWDERQSTAWTGRQWAGQPIWFCSLVQWPLTTPQHYNVTQWGYKVWLLKQSYFWFARLFFITMEFDPSVYWSLFCSCLVTLLLLCPLQGFTTMKPCLDFCEVSCVLHLLNSGSVFIFSLRTKLHFVFARVIFV